MNSLDTRIDEILIPEDNCFNVPGEHCSSCLTDFEDNFDSDMRCCDHSNWRNKAKAAIRSLVEEARLDEARYWYEHILGSPRKVTVHNKANERLDKLNQKEGL